MAETAVAVAYRTHTHVWDSPRGVRWRGGRVLRIDGETAHLEVLAEMGAPLVYRGPSAGLQERTPVVCRMAGRWPYRLVEVRGSHWAAGDAQAGQEGTPGVYGVVPRAITGESDVLWREEPPQNSDLSEWLT